MANHGFIKTRRKLNAKLLGSLLEEVNQERFNGLLVIEKYYGCFTIEDDFQVWINSNGEIEVRHGFGEIGWWVDTIVRHVLAEKVNGTITDEAHDRRYKPNPDKYMGFWTNKIRMARELKDRKISIGKRWFSSLEIICMEDIKSKKFAHLRELVMADYAAWKRFKREAR